MIPKHIHYIWIQGYDEMPSDFKTAMKDCLQHNVGYGHTVWDNNSISIMLKSFDYELYNFYNNPKISYAMKADIARYIIIYLYGGIYVDCDYLCKKSINNLLGTEIDLFYIISKTVTDANIFNGLFGAKQYHPSFKFVIKDMKYMLQSGNNNTADTTGTNMFYSAIQKYHKENPNDDRYLIISDIQLFPCNSWRNETECNEKYSGISFMTHTNNLSWNPMLKAVKFCTTYYKIILLVILFIILLILILL